MALIDKKVKPFHLNAFKPGADDFVTVSNEDIAGKWTVFFFYPADFPFCHKIIQYSGIDYIKASLYAPKLYCNASKVA